jgi:hypothetical protein
VADVFISYTREERERAAVPKRELERLGLSVFFDIEGGIEAGDEFPQRIKDAVGEVSAVLACWSPHALSRPWVRRESMMAQDRGKLVPVAIEMIEPADLPAQFYEISFIDLSDFRAESGHRGWAQVLDTLAGKLEANGASAKASTLRAAAKVARDTDTRPERVVTNASRTGALWDGLKSSPDVAALRRFAEAFPGTAEGYEARARADALDAAEAASAARAQQAARQRADEDRARLRQKSGCSGIMLGSLAVIGALVAIALGWGFVARLLQ